MFTRTQILREAESILPEIIKVRRYLHQHPELSYAENNTAGYIIERLREQDIEHMTGIAGTGIIGIIDGKAAGKGLTVGLRADMDALPLTEDTETGYQSLSEGVMHACGHDAHMAMLLGAAMIIKRMREEFAGKVLLVFQPGEEKAPGGAKLITDSGILDLLRPDIFIAQHVAPELPSGTAGFREGPAMASCDEIYITVTGRGGHAAKPSEHTDQIRIASELVLALKDTVETAAAEQTPALLGIGRITGMGTTNVIPEKVEIEGTLRTFDEKWRREIKKMIHQVAEDLAARRGVTIEMNIVEGYPVLVNNPRLTRQASELCQTLLGTEMVKEIDSRMGSEDFSFYAEKYPAFLYRLGVTPKGNEIRQLHTSVFDLDESAMATGAAIMAWLTLNMIH